jgi:ribosomal protein S27AE
MLRTSLATDPKTERDMGASETGYVVLPEGGAGKRAGAGWLELLRRWLVECPQCATVWLVVGARENDRYICKDCGHGFVIRFLVAPQGNLSESVVGGT